MDLQTDRDALKKTFEFAISLRLLADVPHGDLGRENEPSP